MTGVRSLAAAQPIAVRGDVAANVAHHARLVHAAAEVRARVLVFPELSLTGYELDLAPVLAFSRGDSRLRPFLELAAACQMTIVIGAPVRLDAFLYIGAFIVAPDGTVDLYTKHHLGAFDPGMSSDGVVPPAEATVFQPGTLNPLVRVEGGTAAVAVCADVGRPAHADSAATRGADTYLASMFVIPSDFAGDSGRLQSYAARHSMAVVFSNYGGATGGLPSAGRTAIWSQQGELLVQLPPGGAGVAAAVETEAGWHASIVMLDTW
jgi:predicted amidohydrolase